MSTYLILGFGYTAPYLKEAIIKANPKATVYATTRGGGESLAFNLNDESTWNNIPKVDYCFWMFPAEPLETVKKFHKSVGDRLGGLVVVGSTSAFAVSEKDQWVNEKSPVDKSIPRVQGEEWLRSQGANVVYSAGIYGPDRNPLDWVKKAFVGISDKYLNMVHVQDLSQFLLAAALTEESSQVFIASDGQPQTWRSVIKKWQNKGLLSAVEEKASSRMSKRVSSEYTIQKLAIRLKFPDFSDVVL